MDWSGVDYCDIFISCLVSHSDGTHSLQSIHCWDTDAMLHFSKEFLMNIQTHQHYIFSFGKAQKCYFGFLQKNIFIVYCSRSLSNYDNSSESFWELRKCEEDPFLLINNHNNFKENSIWCSSSLCEQLYGKSQNNSEENVFLCHQNFCPSKCNKYWLFHINNSKTKRSWISSLLAPKCIKSNSKLDSMKLSNFAKSNDYSIKMQ